MKEGQETEREMLREKGKERENGGKEDKEVVKSDDHISKTTCTFISEVGAGYLSPCMVYVHVCAHFEFRHFVCHS